MPNKETVKTASARSSLALPIFIIGIITVLFVVIGLWLKVTLRETNSVVTVGSQSFVVELADTVSEREQGLSERDSMPQNHGMLFDFKQDGIWKMWMLKMRFNLDMAWLDANGKVVYIRENLTPDTFPNVFIPDSNARYVLEVNAGSLKAAGLKVGDTVRL
jgi:uncharacterized membrane protein (UPF0127 family)